MSFGSFNERNEQIDSGKDTGYQQSALYGEKSLINFFSTEERKIWTSWMTMQIISKSFFKSKLL